eukprot:TRINITY_DN7501_c0_g1_i1.p1 TRINITY_DN7501_c0_g1~~TRINITY_DN7501_c0_g1_i1.p1  ORF type:complete len:299 (+),score=47.65 TRINITY_DN7501_c0_g1_i1:25-897(+)
MAKKTAISFIENCAKVNNFSPEQLQPIMEEAKRLQAIKKTKEVKQAAGSSFPASDLPFLIAGQKELQGWLLKKSDWLSWWNKRFIILHKNTLYNFRKQPNKTDKVVDLGGIIKFSNVILETHPGKPLSFVVESQNPPRKFWFQALEQKDYDEWTTTLKKKLQEKERRKTLDSDVRPAFPSAKLNSPQPSTVKRGVSSSNLSHKVTSASASPTSTRNVETTVATVQKRDSPNRRSITLTSSDYSGPVTTTPPETSPRQRSHSVAQLQPGMAKDASSVVTTATFSVRQRPKK